MKTIKAMQMNSQDYFVTRIVLGFLATPLFLLLLAGAAKAMTVA
jgi:hypothetical protein